MKTCFEENTTEISVVKDQAKLNSPRIQMEQDLSLLEKLFMSQLCECIECYCLENNLLGKSQSLILSEAARTSGGINLCTHTLFVYFISLVNQRQNIMLGVCLTHKQKHI